MRSPARQFGVSLVILVIWPLLGTGDRAQASYLVVYPQSRSPLVTQTLESLSPTICWDEGDSGMTGTPVGSKNAAWPEPSPRPMPETPAPTRQALLGVYSLWWSGMGLSGGNWGSPSGVPGAASSVFHAALPEQINLRPVPVVRRLSLEEVHYRPPPFASRLFRPPRLG